MAIKYLAGGVLFFYFKTSSTRTYLLEVLREIIHRPDINDQKHFKTIRNMKLLSYSK